MSLRRPWAIDIARPYLMKHLPGYKPDTTDPRNGRFDVTDDDIMEIDKDKKRAASESQEDAGWTLMGANGRHVKVNPPPDPIIAAAAPPLPPPLPLINQPPPAATLDNNMPPPAIPPAQ
jgi:hypothetical protein